MKTIFALIISIILIIVAYSTVVINGHALFIERVFTLDALQKGLSDRDAIAPWRGMLFQFDKPGTYGFWMKDMYFPIDIVWMNGHSVAGVLHDVPIPHDKDIPTYFPPNSIDHVLELRAGRAHELGITTGTRMYGF